jgi:TldD protein
MFDRYDFSKTSAPLTRRTFVTMTSRGMANACAVIAVGHSGITARRIPLTGSHVPQTFLPEAIDPQDLRRLATGAIDVARQAGAAYADIRVSERHTLDINRPYQTWAGITSTFTYGIRVLVDGAWAFVHGSAPSADAVDASARAAVAMAKGYASLVVHRAEPAPVAAVVNEWATPVQVDPFTVPLREQCAVMHTYYRIAARVRGGNPYNGMPAFAWTKETRVVSNSDGTLTTQHLTGFTPTMYAVASGGVIPYVTLAFPGLPAAAGGFELVADPTRLEDMLLARVEEAARYLMLPKRTLDVGRYPVVVDGATLGRLFGETTGRALELDRVLGEEADASGTSYLSPPLELLGTQIAHPALTVTATRALPHPGAVRWDDEGGETHDYPVITNGTLVDYHTSRWTAPALKDWYARRRQPLRSHGCMATTTAGELPSVRAPHLAIAPGQTSASLNALCHDVKEGVLMVGVEDYVTDQQLSSMSLNADGQDGLRFGMMLQLKHGKIAGIIVGNGVDMSMKRFWNQQLVSLGNAGTVQATHFEVRKGMPWRRSLQSTTAPAGLFKDVNVVAFPKTL